ncbi:MAG: hypothetical protein HQL51_02890 [Magnetococcales bacterium]|nr:hypothetical protein [Magnetococcales bacterium]
MNKGEGEFGGQFPVPQGLAVDFALAFLFLARFSNKRIAPFAIRAARPKVGEADQIFTEFPG